MGGEWQGEREMLGGKSKAEVKENWRTNKSKMSNVHDVHPSLYIPWHTIRIIVYAKIL